MKNPLETAIEKLGQGQIIVIPTETVYGLAVDARNNAAISAIYALKQRVSNKPLQIMVADLAMAEKWVKMDERARAIAQKFLPGPLSLVLNKQDGSGTLAIRIPNHPLTLQLLQNYGNALATTSVNPSGEPPATSAEESLSYYPELHTLDGGKASLGLASTVLDLSKDVPKILREGSVTEADIRHCLNL